MSACQPARGPHVHPLSGHDVADHATPVAVAAFFAASIAQARRRWQTGWYSMRFGWTAYVVPFLFVFSPSLLPARHHRGSDHRRVERDRWSLAGFRRDRGLFRAPAGGVGPALVRARRRPAFDPPWHRGLDRVVEHRRNRRRVFAVTRDIMMARAARSAAAGIARIGPSCPQSAGLVQLAPVPAPWMLVDAIVRACRGILRLRFRVGGRAV